MQTQMLNSRVIMILLPLILCFPNIYIQLFFHQVSNPQSTTSAIYHLEESWFNKPPVQPIVLSLELSQSSMHSQPKLRKLCLMGTLCRGGGNILGPIDVSAPPHQFFVDPFRDACGKEADRSKIWNPLEIFLCWRFGPRFGFLVVHHVTWS